MMLEGRRCIVHGNNLMYKPENESQHELLITVTQHQRMRVSGHDISKNMNYLAELLQRKSPICSPIFEYMYFFSSKS